MIDEYGREMIWDFRILDTRRHVNIAQLVSLTRFKLVHIQVDEKASSV